MVITLEYLFSPEFIVIFVLLALWGVGFVLLFHFKLFDRLKWLSPYGPFLMLKTQLGKRIIERISSRHTFWRRYAFVAIALVVLSGVVMLLLIIMGAVGSMNPQVKPVSLREVLVIPGWNPMIPLGYGLLALIIAVVVHEGSHGIMTRASKLKVKSLGILFFIIPVGAFVEPDEEDIQATTRLKRVSIFAMGPASNIVLGLVCLLVFSWVFMGSVVSAEDGLIVQGLYENGPADKAGVEPYWDLVSIENTRIQDLSDLMAFQAEPNTTVTAHFFVDGTNVDREVMWGMYIQEVSKDFPANLSGIKAGTYIYSINGIHMRSWDMFHTFMDNTSAGDHIDIVVLEPDTAKLAAGEGNATSWREHEINGIELADKYDAYPGFSVFRGKGFLGVSVIPLGSTFVDASAFRDVMARPALSAFDPPSSSSGAKLLMNIMYVGVMLPTERVLMPIPMDFASNYEVQGPLSIIPAPIYWTLANIFYYLFWLNILLGTFNALPAMPLDGGFIFRDAVDYIIHRILGKDFLKKRSALVKAVVAVATIGSGKDEEEPDGKVEKKEELSGNDIVARVSFRITLAVSIFVGLLILFSLFMPVINLLLAG